MPPSEAPRGKILLDDCFLHDKDRLRHNQAIALLRKRLRPIAGTTPCPLAVAHGKILAETITAPRNVPDYDNSAVDGYAFRMADFQTTDGEFQIAARIAAGDIGPADLPAGMAARIFTGAPLPRGADTVAMQEDCESRQKDGREWVSIPAGLKPGANVRLAGEDLQAGGEIAAPGLRLRPQEIAAIASIGVAQVQVFKPLRVALISSGNELKRPGDPLQRGEVYDSNYFLLSSLLTATGAEVTDIGILPDDAGMVRKAVQLATRSHDVILSSGGASRGEEDHLVKTLDALGSCHLWQLAIKPGRPMSFGQIGDTVMFGLPGNPVAGFVCFLLYVRPALTVLGGGDWQEPERYRLPVGFEIQDKKPDRREFWRGRIERDQSGNPVLQKFHRDGSGLITGLREAHGLIEVPEETTRVREGDLLDFIPFSQFR